MAVLTKQRWSRRLAAAEIDVDFTHFANAIAGRSRPSQAIRDRLPELLGVPLEDLFEPEMLAGPYMGDLGIGNTAARRARDAR
jgi:hypothetical protein